MSVGDPGAVLWLVWGEFCGILVGYLLMFDGCLMLCALCFFCWRDGRADSGFICFIQ